MYRLLLVVLVVLCPGTARSTAPSPAPCSEIEILASLEEPFSCDVKDKMTLGKALMHIRQTANLEIFVDHASLRECGVTEETPVKFHLPFMLPLRDALDYLLKQHDLAWIVKHEMLNITSAEKAKGPWFNQAYYIGDLLPTTLVTPPKYDSPLDAITAANVGTHHRATYDFSAIIDYITTMVAPESWKNGGGIMEYQPNLSLVVRQHEVEHAEIAELLARLRKKQNAQIMFEVEALTSTTGYSKGPRVICFNGTEASIEFNNSDDMAVRVAPVSSEPLPEELTANNKPFILSVPKGKTVTVRGVVRPGNIIKATVTVAGQEPQTRSFHAAPFRQEEEEEFLMDGIPVGLPIISQSTVELRSGKEQEIYRQLEMPVMLNFDKPKPLGRVLQLLKEQTGIEIFVDQTTLHEVGVTTETPVLIQLIKAVRLKSVLNLVLEQLGLTYLVENEMLHITSISKAKEKYVTRSYDVADLVNDDETSLVELIETVVSPDSWKEGGEAVIDEGGKLVVIQKLEVHAVIVELLSDLRKFNASVSDVPIPVQRGGGRRS